ncbi:MAG: hypothetical protein FWC40_03025, partial [Proteobacteria bacterium]|nr:hypothetical protein [Pseudomonadota bacterium]
MRDHSQHNAHQSESSLIHASNAIDMAAFAEYERQQASLAEDEDSIDFGDGIAKSAVVVVDKNSAAAEDPSPLAMEDAIHDMPVVSHKGESTLMVDSPLLRAIEEVNGERAKPKQRHWPILVTLFLVVLAAILGGVVVIAKIFITEEMPQEEEALAEPETPAFEPLPVVETQMSIIPGNANVLINGVFVPPTARTLEGGSYPLAADRSNAIAIYHDGYVPYLDVFNKDRNFVEYPVSVELVSSELYQTSRLTIRAPENADVAKMLIYVNGRVLLPMQEYVIQTVSGFPYFIQVRYEGMGDHLHVIWPTRAEETLQLPELQTQFNSDRTTLFTLSVPKDFEQDRSFSIRIAAEGRHHTKTGTLRVSKAELIELALRKGGRFPLNMVFDSTPFGSITVDSYMQLSSQSIAHINFGRRSSRDLTLCFRRVAELVCAEPGG